jgi:lipopolysaccharide biosynthesis glycosyltransferase
MPSRALVTLQIGSADYFPLARESFQHACERFGWDLRVIDARRWRLLPIRRAVRRLQFEKFQLHDLLGQYERILFLDSDILALPSLPDVFNAVPPEAVGCVDEERGPLAWKRQAERERAQRRLGRIDGWDHGYFNSGVLVLSSAHRELFRMRRWRLVDGRWADQSTLNHRARHLGLPLHPLPPAFNFLPLEAHWDDPAGRLAAHLVHYAGAENKPLLHADFPAVRERWAASGAGAAPGP